MAYWRKERRDLGTTLWTKEVDERQVLIPGCDRLEYPWLAGQYTLAVTTLKKPVDDYLKGDAVLFQVFDLPLQYKLSEKDRLNERIIRYSIGRIGSRPWFNHAYRGALADGSPWYTKLTREEVEGIHQTFARELEDFLKVEGPLNWLVEFVMYERHDLIKRIKGSLRTCMMSHILDYRLAEVITSTDRTSGSTADRPDRPAGPA
jgi:hypothetical protein